MWGSRRESAAARGWLDKVKGQSTETITAMVESEPTSATSTCWATGTRCTARLTSDWRWFDTVPGAVLRFPDTPERYGQLAGAGVNLPPGRRAAAGLGWLGPYATGYPMADELQTLQLALREFAREREWEQFHSPKNLAAALSV